MHLEPGDIYWVTLRNSGKVINGRRPCIIMSRLAVNNAGDTVMVVPMTSQGAANAFYRIQIDRSALRHDCWYTCGGCGRKQRISTVNATSVTNPDAPMRPLPADLFLLTN